MAFCPAINHFSVAILLFISLVQSLFHVSRLHKYKNFFTFSITSSCTFISIFYCLHALKQSKIDRQRVTIQRVSRQTVRRLWWMMLELKLRGRYIRRKQKSLQYLLKSSVFSFE